MSASNVTALRPRTDEEIANELPKREAEWARARVRLTRAVADYDQACRGAHRNAINDCGGSLYDAETALLRAVGLLTVAVEYDRKHQGSCIPDEVAEAILFLASPNAGWITGETLAIDGGRQLTCAR